MYQMVLPISTGPNLKLFRNNMISGYLAIIFSLINMFFAVFLTLKLWNFPKYTYDEYKAIMDKKKIESQEKKKLKLKQQLNILDKTE